MTCHYPDLGRAYHWLKQISLSTRPFRSTTKIWVVTSYRHGNSAVLRRYFAEKPVMESRNVGQDCVFSLAKINREKQNETSAFLE